MYLMEGRGRERERKGNSSKARYVAVRMMTVFDLIANDCILFEFRIFQQGI